jgi:hypothetical protein
VTLLRGPRPREPFAPDCPCALPCRGPLAAADPPSSGRPQPLAEADLRLAAHRARKAPPNGLFGGGYDDPALRDPALVEADLRDGFVGTPVPLRRSAAG